MTNSASWESCVDQAPYISSTRPAKIPFDNLVTGQNRCSKELVNSELVPNVKTKEYGDRQLLWPYWFLSSGSSASATQIDCEYDDQKFISSGPSSRSESELYKSKITDLCQKRFQQQSSSNLREILKTGSQSQALSNRRLNSTSRMRFSGNLQQPSDLPATYSCGLSSFLYPFSQLVNSSKNKSSNPQSNFPWNYNQGQQQISDPLTNNSYCVVNRKKNRNGCCGDFPTIGYRENDSPLNREVNDLSFPSSEKYFQVSSGTSNRMKLHEAPQKCSISQSTDPSINSAIHFGDKFRQKQRAMEAYALHAFESQIKQLCDEGIAPEVYSCKNNLKMLGKCSEGMATVESRIAPRAENREDDENGELAMIALALEKFFEAVGMSVVKLAEKANNRQISSTLFEKYEECLQSNELQFKVIRQFVKRNALASLKQSQLEDENKYLKAKLSQEENLRLSLQAQNSFVRRRLKILDTMSSEKSSKKANVI